jgi:hypothetical protein
MDVLNSVANPSTPAPTEWFVPYAADPEAVRAFCARHGILADAETTLRIAQECFNPTKITIQVEYDPEDDGEWLGIDIFAKFSVDEMRAANARFTTRRIATVSLNKIPLIRVDYNFA